MACVMIHALLVIPNAILSVPAHVDKYVLAVLELVMGVLVTIILLLV